MNIVSQSDLKQILTRFDDLDTKINTEFTEINTEIKKINTEIKKLNDFNSYIYEISVNNYIKDYFSDKYTLKDITQRYINKLTKYYEIKTNKALFLKITNYAYNKIIKDKNFFMIDFYKYLETDKCTTELDGLLDSKNDIFIIESKLFFNKDKINAKLHKYYELLNILETFSKKEDIKIDYQNHPYKYFMNKIVHFIFVSMRFNFNINSKISKYYIYKGQKYIYEFSVTDNLDDLSTIDDQSGGGVSLYDKARYYYFINNNPIKIHNNTKNYKLRDFNNMRFIVK